MAFIEVKDLKHVFLTKDKTATVALDGLSFSVEENEFVAILGPSGCGKTTLLRMLDGLIYPTGGDIFIKGEKVKGPGKDRAMVFQEFGLLPWRTTLGNIEMGLEFYGMGRKERHKICQEMIKVVGLEGFENAFPHQLSGGMRQRVSIARALTVDPDIYLMDEPFAALDAQMRELMQEELMRIHSQFRRTVVFITHSIDEAIYLADRVIVISARPGKVKLEVDVPIPREERVGRSSEVKASKDFAMVRKQAWDILRAEILRTRDTK